MYFALRFLNWVKGHFLFWFFPIIYIEFCVLSFVGCVLFLHFLNQGWLSERKTHYSSCCFGILPTAIRALLGKVTLLLTITVTVIIIVATFSIISTFLINNILYSCWPRQVGRHRFAANFVHLSFLPLCTFSAQFLCNFSFNIDKWINLKIQYDQYDHHDDYINHRHCHHHHQGISWPTSK